MAELYIGLMSGTSVDGIDAVLVDFSRPQPQLVGTYYQEFASDLRQSILALCHPGEDEINRLGKLDVTLGKAFAHVVNTLLENHSIKPKAIRAIGSHGQTIRHHPYHQFTLQIGDPNIIAAHTGITTIADFRRRDLAYEGQGAPLVPAFHQMIFAKKNLNRIVLNLGGIANVTLLFGNEKILGFDTGPGNTLLDAWAEQHIHEPCDKNGEWAAQGKLCPDLLQQLLSDSFFQLPAPKSTGREYFNLSWLNSFLSKSYSPIDVQTTLVELTAKSIIDAVNRHMSEGEILICGGGVYNAFLVERIRQLAPSFWVDSTQKFGVDPDWVESMAFAWLAKQTLEGKTGNITAVTGAKKASILGGVYYT